MIFDAGTGEFWSADGQRFGRPSAWNYEAIGGSVDLGLDTNNAHVQPTGKYHYHGLSDALVKSRAVQAESSGMTLIGWAFDGFPVYAPYGHVGDAESQVIPLKSSYRLKEGTRPETPEGPGGAYDGSFGADWEYVEGLGDLDECNGRFGVTPEFPEGTYYYAVTKSYPYIPRFWRGEVSAEFKKGPGGGPGANGPGNGQGQPDRRGERPQRRPNP